MSVVDHKDTHHDFTPVVSMGLLHVEPDFAQAAQSIDAAEHQALNLAPLH
jgi:hypothetical protein